MLYGLWHVIWELRLTKFHCSADHCDVAPGKMVFKEIVVHKMNTHPSGSDIKVTFHFWVQHFQENLDTNSFQICFDTESFAHAINLPFYPLLGAEIICYLNYSANFTSIQTVQKWMIHLHFGHNFWHNFGQICSNLSFIGIKCEICWWMFLLNLGFKMLKMILPFEPENGCKHIFLSSD